MSDLERRRACVRARPRRSNKENGPFSRAAGFSRKLCFFYYHLLRCFFLDVVSYEPVSCFFCFFFFFFLHILIFHTFSSTRQVVRICSFPPYIYLHYYFHFGSWHAHAPVVSHPSQFLSKFRVELSLFSIVCSFLFFFCFCFFRSSEEKVAMFVTRDFNNFKRYFHARTRVIEDRESDRVYYNCCQFYIFSKRSY